MKFTLPGLALLAALLTSPAAEPARKTNVAIAGEEFYINGQPTYAGRTWNGKKIQGLLMNSRMVQATFDDLNLETASRWAYPDTKKWDAERNTREFLTAMPEWRRHGLLAFTLNLQGGSPQGYSRDQPWENNAFTSDGSPRPGYLARLERILNRADELGMVVILGYFYFGQDERLKDEAAVLRATDNATKWLLEHGWRNVLVEVNNECNVRYDHAILKPERVHELIERVKHLTHNGRRLLVSTSYGGNTVPKENVVRASDFLLLHGNGVSKGRILTLPPERRSPNRQVLNATQKRADSEIGAPQCQRGRGQCQDAPVSKPERIAELVRLTRAVPGYTPKPILFNEDDHFDFDQPMNNFTAAVGERAGWGFFDFRMKDEGFDEGYQSVPVNWGISSARKRGFFRLLAEITGAQP